MLEVVYWRQVPQAGVRGMQDYAWVIKGNFDIDNVNVSADKNKNMSIQDKKSALEAEIAAANARIAKAKAQVAAAERRTIEHRARATKAEAEVLKLLSSPNFPETEKQRILAKMRAFGSEV